MRVIAAQGDTLDALCFRHYGRTQTVVESVLAANPGLAEWGVILPQGTGIELPAMSTAPQRETLNLWD